jgi:hypothetical protein
VAEGPRVALQDFLPVGGERERAAHADVLERLAVQLHHRHPAEEHDELPGLESRFFLPRHVQIDPAHAHPVLGRKVVVAGEPPREPRGGVVVDHHVDGVGVGQARDEIVRMAHEDQARARLVALQHPGSRPDARLRALEIAEVLHGFARHDPRDGRGEVVEEPGKALAELDLHGMPIDDLDPLHVLEQAAVGAALESGEALVGVLHVVRRELATVHGRLVVPPHALAQSEDVRRVVRLRPRLREVALERQVARHHGRAGLYLQEPAVGEGQVRHRARLIGDDVRIEAGGGILAADSKDAAPGGRLRGRRLVDDCDGGREGDRAQLQRVTTTQ